MSRFLGTGTQEQQIRERYGFQLQLARGIVQAVETLCDNPDLEEYTFQVDGETITVTTEYTHGFDLKVTVAGEDGHDEERCHSARHAVVQRVSSQFNVSGKFDRVPGRNAFKFVINTF